MGSHSKDLTTFSSSHCQHIMWSGSTMLTKSFVWALISLWLFFHNSQAHEIVEAPGQADDINKQREESDRQDDGDNNNGDGKNSTGGFWNIHLSPNSISSVPFGPGHLTVWEHVDSPGRYYAMPLVDLLNKRVTSRYNVVIGKYEMTFDILMWSVEAKQAIYHHLKEEGRNIDSEDNVEMLPMENVRITWKGESFSSDAPGRFQDNWRSNTDLPPVLTFQMICRAKSNCDQLADAMRATPSMFTGLHLEYIINGHQSSRRNIEITGSMISNGKLFTKLENMPNMKNKSDRYISSDDMKNIVSETVSNLVATVTRDSNYIDTGDEVSLSDLIEHVLTRNEETSDTFEPRKWNSVFWDPTWARPDKISNYLNEALKKFQNDSEYFYTTDRARQSSGNGNANFELFGIFKLGGGGGSSKDVKEKVSIRDIEKIMEEEDTKVQWTGEVFKVKPMKFYRLNLAQLKTSASIAVGSLQIHQYETVQTIPVRVTPGTYVGNNGTSSLTAELVQSRLRQEMANMSEVLSEELKNKSTTIASELKSLNTQVTNLRGTDGQFQTKISAAESKLATLDGQFQNKISAAEGWPTGRYCIFAGAYNKCPHGFTFREGHTRVKGDYHCAKNYIKVATFGASSITCQYAKRADLRLRVCCK